MEKAEIRLNDFLFNSGVLGLYKIIEKQGKQDEIEIKSNIMTISASLFKNFEEDYIKTMIDIYEKDTRYATLIEKKEKIRKLNIEEKDNIKILEQEYSQIKKAMESASYKAGYEIVKQKGETEDPYQIIEMAKKEKEVEKIRELTLEILNHIEKNKEIYCMKDIIYTKINSFWENVAFLNRNSNKKDIKEEYKKVFVIPVLEYISKERKSDYNCIECGNIISKQEAFGMSWLKDVGIDINRKKSGFWNFKEDMFICPICALIYSCVPLGFNMIGSNGIFVNNNDSIRMLIKTNKSLEGSNERKEESYEKTYQKVLYNFINRTDQIGNKERVEHEIKNIQVIKRVGGTDNRKYEFNRISKEKLEIIKNTINKFEYLASSKLYQQVLTNVIEGRKQYKIIAKCLKNEENVRYVRDILSIQANSIGGIKVKEREIMIDDMIREGENLQKKFYIDQKNANKLKSYSYKLQGALNANNVEEFMKVFTMFYGGMGQSMPNSNAIKTLMKDSESFRLLGYAYIYGLQKYVGENKKRGGNENEG